MGSVQDFFLFSKVGVCCIKTFLVTVCAKSLFVLIMLIIIFYFMIIVLLGASSGIGAATAILFSQLGAKLSLGGRNKQNLETVDKKCKDSRSDAEVQYKMLTAEINNYRDSIV